MTKILSFLTTTCRYIILCTCRLQPPRDACAIRVQWFSSVNLVELAKENLCQIIYDVFGEIPFCGVTIDIRGSRSMARVSLNLIKELFTVLF